MGAGLGGDIHPVRVEPLQQVKGPWMADMVEMSRQPVQRANSRSFKTARVSVMGGRVSPWAEDVVVPPS